MATKNKKLISEGKGRERDGHLHAYYSSSRGWGDGHLHSSYFSPFPNSKTFENVIQQEQKERGMATSILTILPQGDEEMSTSTLLILLWDGEMPSPLPSSMKLKKTKKQRGLVTPSLFMLHEGDGELANSILPTLLEGMGRWPCPFLAEGRNYREIALRRK